MSIPEGVEIVKSKISPFYSLILVVIVAATFFGLGRLSVLEEQKTPIKIIYPNSDQTGSVIGATVNTPTDLSAQAGSALLQDTGGTIFGNKNSKKYYFPWCSAVKASKPENLVSFASIEEARSAGYVPGGNCKGLE